MISVISGLLSEKADGWIQIKVSGVGFHILVPSTTLDDLGNIGDSVEVYTHLQIRDDEINVYGFSQQNALSIFKLLTKVSGVGPRTALTVLSSMRTEAIASAISSGDVEAFGQVSGIGKKTAARIVLELKGKLELDIFDDGDAMSYGQDQEAFAALIALGYTSAEVRKAMSRLGAPTSNESLSERIRKALVELGNN